MNFVKNKKLLVCFIAFLFFSFLIGVNFSLAAESTILPGGGNGCKCTGENLSDACKQYCGAYELNDMVKLLVTGSQWLLGIVGSLALLMFIYGGVMFLISSGSSERVTQAKQTIVAAVIGLVIVFTSYMIIGFIFSAAGINITGTAWSNSGWFTK